jgi:ABC-type transporter MlaC component
MKKILLSMIGLLWASMSFAAEIDPQKAEDFIKQVTTQGIEEIINSDVSAAEKNERFAKLFNEYLDVAFIGRFVLGRSDTADGFYRCLSRTERSDMVQAF